MGYIPQEALSYFDYRGNRRRPYYTTIADLYNWAATKTSETQEGDLYHDALDKWEDMIEELTGLFDGSMTFVDPVTQEEKTIVALLEDEDDMQDYIFTDYNTRLVWWPLFSHVYEFTTDPAVLDARFYSVLEHFCKKVHRFYLAYSHGIYKSLATLSIEYNPITDYWTKKVELGANAPYVSLTNGTGEEPTISSWIASNVKTDYKTKAGTGGEQPKTTNYTSTYDDSSTGRLAGYQTTDGATISEIPNSGYVRKNTEEGNKSGTIQDIIEKELELSNKLNGLLQNFLNTLMNEVCLNVIYSD